MIGKTYFDFRDGQYRLLNNGQLISSMCAVYQEDRDKCYYFATNRKWKSAPLTDLPSHTQYVFYWSGNLQTPDWMQMRHSLMTPLTGPHLPHVPFPPSAF